MSEASRDDFRTIWRELAQRNDWCLVEDEGAFLDQAIAEFDALTSTGAASALRRLALLRAYNRRLYQGLADGHERASVELRSALRRMALKDGCSEREAQDLAHEAITCVFEKLATLRDPGSLIAWARTTLFRIHMKRSKARAEVHYPTTDDDTVRELPDPTDMAAKVVDIVIEQELRALLRARFPDELDRQVVWRGAVLDEKSSAIAQDLGLDPALVRLRKSRALRRLREDKRFMRALRSMIDEPAPPARATGLAGLKTSRRSSET